MPVKRLLRRTATWAADSSDAIPGWLLWPAIALSAAAVAFGLVSGWGDFLFNVAANLALLGPGLFLTNRVVRTWRYRELRNPAHGALAHLGAAFDDLREDLGDALAGSVVPVPQPMADSASLGDRLTVLGIHFGAMADALETSAPRDGERVTVPARLNPELGLAYFMEALRNDVRSLTAVFAAQLPGLEAEADGLVGKASQWDERRGTEEPASQVHERAARIARAAGGVAIRLGEQLPVFLRAGAGDG